MRLGFLNLNLAVEEFDDWYMDIPFRDGDVRIVCCPEDRICSETCLAGRRLCQSCQVPVCTTCNQYVSKEQPMQNPIALANDLMVFYTPEEMYTGGGLTVMEMTCASPCITSMIFFSLEVQFGNMFNEIALMNRHRVGARGDATRCEKRGAGRGSRLGGGAAASKRRRSFRYSAGGHLYSSTSSE